MLLAAETVAALRTTLEAGCTTARDLGGLDAGFREAVARGLIPGPRLQCSLVIVSPTNGIVDATTPQGLASPVVPGMPRPECNGPYGARAKVREVLRQGADVIKIATSGGVSSAKLASEAPDLHAPRRSRRSSTRLTWRGCRCAATRSAARGS